MTRVYSSSKESFHVKEQAYLLQIAKDRSLRDKFQRTPP